MQIERPRPPSSLSEDLSKTAQAALCNFGKYDPANPAQRGRGHFSENGPMPRARPKTAP
jgi:hypothetical protein